MKRYTHYEIFFMNYKDWLDTVPDDLKNDSVWRLEVYRQSLLAADLAWSDVSKLLKDIRTRNLADQIYRAVGSIGSNIVEGYSRRSPKDQARMYEYALGSAREARHRYYTARHLLGDAVTTHRIDLQTNIIRMLLTIIPSERGSKISRIKEDTPVYDTANLYQIEEFPMP